MWQPVTGNNPATVQVGDWVTLRYECVGGGWTITPVDTSPALDGMYAGPVWLMHGDVLMFTANGPNIDQAWMTELEARKRDVANLGASLEATEKALEASQDEVQQLKDALVRMATG